VQELLRTADPVRLTRVQSLLEEIGIPSVVLDNYTAGLLTAGVVPRLMVADDDLAEARRSLREFGEALDG
jgi:hypothetical protein